MKRLDRTCTPAPTALNNYRHGVQNWSCITGTDKQAIRTSLEQMQGKICAYCESSLDDMGQHIEHFRRRAEFPQLTFSWENLYWSCDKSDSCGHFKDNKADAYNISDIIDPCCDNPDHFFRFRADGTISIRPGLSTADSRRAAETLRVLNLAQDHGRLKNMRRNAVAGYLKIVEDLQEFDEADKRELIQEELNKISGCPFSTVIRHVLTDFNEA